MTISIRYPLVVFVTTLLLLLSEERVLSNVEESSCSTLSIPNVPTIPLRNGVDLPVLSLGTAHVILDDDEEETDDSSLPSFMGFLPERTYRQVQLALESGIRSFEMGRIYRSHRPVGHVLGEWFRTGQLVLRNDVFLITKVFHGNAERVATQNSHMHNMEDLTPNQVTEQVTSEIEEALSDLGVGYIDLLLLHWPASALGDGGGGDVTANRQRRLAAWKVLERFYQKGWVRAIGVSNFSEHHLEQLREDGATITPMVNQIEASLSVQYPHILDYCQQHQIVCQAFSPLKRGKLLDEWSSTVVESIAEKYSKTSAQVALRYLVQMGYAVIFLSTNAERMVSNHDIFDFELNQQELEELNTLPRDDGNWGLPTPYELE